MMDLSSYAASRGVDKSTISRQIKAGLIPVVRDGRKVLLDPALADEARKNNLNLNKSRKPTASSMHGGQQPDYQKSYNDARKLKEQFAAREAELDYLERIGKLVSLDKVAEQAFNASRELRNRLLALPRDIAGRCAAEGDELVIARIIKDAITQCLIQAADAFASTTDDPDASKSNDQPGDTA